MRGGQRSPPFTVQPADARMKSLRLQRALGSIALLLACACVSERDADRRKAAASGPWAAGADSPSPALRRAPPIDPRLAELCLAPGEAARSEGRPAGFARRELDSADHLFRTRSSDLDTPMRCIARTEEQLALLWSRAHRWVPPPGTPPLDGGMVVLASMGMRSSTGYGIGIDSVLVRADTALVFVMQRTPGSHCTEGMLASSPTDAVRIPHAVAVRFHETVDEDLPCNDHLGPDGAG